MFAEMPLDNRTVNKFESSTVTLPCQAVGSTATGAKRSNISLQSAVL
jgi:hypothetical protein